ncbi:unnamed protein product [Cylindrotheca closterium]|uniref:Uncharacterized protein n=1 Tax=Cylindrotheca closterium TaxID=2856 RepID=A0AAD2PV72_9STRA|nr:unnamed protein product [Cylindrotheca closterium]
MIGIRVFAHCQVLAEVDLSATAIKEIPMCAFEACSSLQTVSLPRSLERIGHASFMECTDLVTIIVPLDSKQPIEIEETSFQFCRSLANLVLPRGSTKVSMARYNASPGPPLLQDRFGEDMDSVIAGLISRFDDYPLHKCCYDHSSTTTTAQELRLLIGKDQGAMEASSLVDAFGMTPFHILFSTISPRRDLLQVLLDKLPCSGIILDWKDANGKLAVDYLLLSNFWNSDDNKMILFQMTIQAWMVDRLERWGATVWRSRMISLIDNLLVVLLLPAEDHDKERRMTAFRETLWSTWKRYEAVESTSILEKALWKRTLKSKWNNDNALDRNGYRVICGAGFVIPKVLQFLDTPIGSSRRMQ